MNRKIVGILTVLLVLMGVIAGVARAATSNPKDIFCKNVDAGVSCKAVPKDIADAIKKHPEYIAASTTYNLDVAQAGLIEGLKDRDGNPLTEVIVPQKSYDEKRTEQNVMVIYVDSKHNLTGGIVIHEALTSEGKEISFRKGDGTLVSGMIMGEGGKVLRHLDGDPHALGENWSCFGNCLSNIWDLIPGWVRWACGTVCGKCLTDPTKLTCLGCYSCLGAFAGGCFIACWNR